MLTANYATLIHEQMVELDPDNAEYYDANYEELTAHLEKLDQQMSVAAQTVPEENRKLLTYHDSWAYWAPLYGFTVIGAIQPSDFAEPSAHEVADLIDQVNEEERAGDLRFRGLPERCAGNDRERDRSRVRR